jgi:hypothetical protein
MTEKVVDAHVQRLISAVKMMTVLDDVLPKRAVLFYVFCGQKDDAKIIH